MKKLKKNLCLKVAGILLLTDIVNELTDYAEAEIKMVVSSFSETLKRADPNLEVEDVIAELNLFKRVTYRRYILSFLSVKNTF